MNMSLHGKDFIVDIVFNVSNLIVVIIIINVLLISF